MKLVAVSMARNEEYWIWYSLTSVYPHVDHILFFDNFSEDRTLAIVKTMAHIHDKLTIVPGFGASSEQENRELTLEAARETGATHLLFLDGDEVHVDEDLGFARRLLEVTDHEPPLHDPPQNHGEVGNHSPTDGILIKNIGFRPVHPGFAGPRTSIPADHHYPDNEHSCYNFAIRIASLSNLKGNGKEWGEHGFLESGDLHIQSSPHTLWCPRLFYFHFRHHPRSPLPRSGRWAANVPALDLGSMAAKEGVSLPEVLFRPEGPGNPTLEHWGIAPGPSGL
ncbi:MAG: hypothetical protein ACE5F1_16400 [Planctomycetota bacterium]